MFPNFYPCWWGVSGGLTLLVDPREPSLQMVTSGHLTPTWALQPLSSYTRTGRLIYLGEMNEQLTIRLLELLSWALHGELPASESWVISREPTAFNIWKLLISLHLFLFCQMNSLMFVNKMASLGWNEISLSFFILYLFKKDLTLFFSARLCLIGISFRNQ